MSAKSGPVGVGMIGAGVICDQYLEHLALYPDVRVLFIADVNTERAHAQAEKYQVPGFGTVAELLDNDDIEIVVNLTIPTVHVEVSLAALKAGKNVWSEKPISLDRESGRSLVTFAQEAGLLVGVAPDTVLGAGIQSGMRAIRSGEIGTPLSALTSIQNPGPDLWHPNPDFLFQVGAGPVLDVGPYYLTTLVHVFGPVARVQAVGRKTRAVRQIHTGPRAGESFTVETPTNVGAILEFEAGGFALSHFSFDSPLRRAGFVEITGSEATIRFPDPNVFGGPLAVTRVGEEAVVVETDSTDLGRGLGVVDMARAIRGGGPIVASAEVALHVIDVLLAIEEAAASGGEVVVETTVSEVPVLDRAWDPRASTL